MSELKKRARAAGLAQDALDAADDLDDPKAAVVELLVSLESTAATTSGGYSLQTQDSAGVSTPRTSAAGLHQEPEPEQEASGVAMTPEQVRTSMAPHLFMPTYCCGHLRSRVKTTCAVPVAGRISQSPDGVPKHSCRPRTRGAV